MPERTGQKFLPPEPVIPSRLEVLMRSKNFVIVGEDEVLKDEATLAGERTELLQLLHEKLQSDPTALTTEEARKMLQLERRL